MTPAMTNEKKKKKKQAPRERTARTGSGVLAGSQEVWLVGNECVSRWRLWVAGFVLRRHFVAFLIYLGGANGKMQRGQPNLARLDAASDARPGAFRWLTAQGAQRGVILIPQGCNFAAGAWREDACNFRRYHGTVCITITLSGPDISKKTQPPFFFA